MEIKVSHQHSQEVALAKTKEALREAGEQYGKVISDVEEVWEGPIGTCSFTVMGAKIKARVVVDQGCVCMEGKVPFMMSMLRPKIEKLLRENMERVLA